MHMNKWMNEWKTSFVRQILQICNKWLQLSAWEYHGHRWNTPDNVGIPRTMLEYPGHLFRSEMSGVFQPPCNLIIINLSCIQTSFTYSYVANRFSAHERHCTAVNISQRLYEEFHARYSLIYFVRDIIKDSFIPLLVPYSLYCIDDGTMEYDSSLQLLL